MTWNKMLLLFAMPIVLMAFRKDDPVKLKFNNFIVLKVPEPSGIAVAPKGNSYFIVSDDAAAVYEIDLSGKILRSSATLGIDLEAICARPDFLYVSDETPRKIYQLDYATLQVTRTFHVPYSGGRNKGFESLTYNEAKKCFVLITERDPVYIIELDHDFRQINEYRWKHARDVSSATYFNGSFWILSDEDMTVFKCNPANYEIQAQYKINVHNPEGIAFHDGKMLILSDDMERLYYFNQP